MDDGPIAAAPAKPAPAASTQTAKAAPDTSSAATTSTTQASGMQTTGPTGLSRFLGFFSPYRVDVQQGNFVSREMVEQLRETMQRPEGVNREQVRFALGTPLLRDIFHADRWDYPFRLQRRNGEVISSRVSVFFENNRVARIDSGELPTEQEYLALIAGGAPASKAASDKQPAAETK